MEEFGVLINTCLRLLKMEFSIWGFTFSFWHILLFGMVAGIVIWFLTEVFNG